MRLIITKAALLITALAVLPADAYGQQLVPSGHPCTYSLAFGSFTPSPVSCWGAFDKFVGNTQEYQDAIVDSLNVWASPAAPWTFIDKADGDSTGPSFETVTWGADGEITFSNPMTVPFVLALKASNSFSLYYFDSPLEQIGKVSYVTRGVSIKTNNNGENPQALSNVSLFTGTTVTPEPSTVILLGSGLLGLGIVGYRGRRKKED